MKLRLIPIVLVATVALLVLKSIGLLVSDGMIFSSVIVEAAAQDGAGKVDPPAGNGNGQTNVPQAAGAQQEQAEDAMMTPSIETGSPTGAPVDLGKSRSERAVLQRLRERRQTLDGLERQLQLREQLLRAAESRIEQRVVEMKALEERIGVASGEKAEQEKRDFANLAKMYQSMKPKDAARIFDRLDLSILVKVSKAMKPAQLGDVVAAMSAEAAERLTIELATGGTGAGRAMPMSELPKIGGN